MFAKLSFNLLALWLTVACISVASARAADATVAQNGDGQFMSIQDAINAAPQRTSRDKPWVIAIKPGVYKELIYIQREKRFITLLGEDPTKTILTYNLNANLPGPDGKPIGTFRTASTFIDADDFTARNLTFENSAGPVGQALAIRIEGDRVSFHNCRFLGWQDTILANRGRHYFENCYIAGHVDFIFGGATAFFESCHIHCLRNGYITAASTPAEQEFGFVFSHCRITGERPEVKTYLGRPWREFANTIFLNTEMSEVVRPAGWHNWDKPAREKTSRYAEFDSGGPGGKTPERVAWAKQLTKDEASKINAQHVLGGLDKWQSDVSNKQSASQQVAEKSRDRSHDCLTKAGVRRDIEYGRAGGRACDWMLASLIRKAPIPQ